MSDDPNLYESDTSNRCGEPLAYGDAVSVCNQTKGHGGEWHGRWSHTGIVIKRWPVAVHPVWCVHEPPYCPTVAECHMRRRSEPVGSVAGSVRPISAREAARRRLRLDGADAQALEHALTITERERDALKADLAEAEAHHVEHHEGANYSRDEHMAALEALEFSTRMATIEECARWLEESEDLDLVAGRMREEMREAKP